MKILADLHHSELYYSLQLLFEKRMGFELYRPIGTEWYPDYWMVHDHPATIQQYLGLDQAIKIPTDVHGNPLPESARLNANYRFEDGIYYVNDPTRDKINRGITLEKFKSMKFDIIIASMPQHIKLFTDLQKSTQVQGKLIFQIGNSWSIPGDIKNVLASCAPVAVPAGTNAIFYHQELDVDTFHYKPPTGTRKIYSFIHYMKNKGAMNQLQASLPDWECKSFGAGMEDSASGNIEVSNKMREADFGFIFKPEGDGFGHSVHGLFAVGRPPIVWGSHYRGKLAGQLMEHNLTCLDVEKLGSIEATAQRIKELSGTDQHLRMCEAAHQRFKEVVDYDAEFEEIKKFIDRLI